MARGFGPWYRSIGTRVGVDFMWMAGQGRGGRAVERSVESSAGELARLVARAERRIGKAVDRSLMVLGTSSAQRPVLEALGEHAERTPAELAAAAHVEGPPMSRMLRRMESAGLVKRRDDPSDRRRTLVSLTPKGQRLREVLPTVADGALAKAWESLPVACRQRLREDLIALIAALEGDGR